MGNTQQGKPNNKLGVPIVGKIESYSSRPGSERGMVLGCYILLPDNTVPHEYASLFHVVIVTPKGIEMYCLLTGEKRYPSYTPPPKTTIVSSVFSQDFIQNAHLIVAESNGGFTLIEAYTLRVDKRIGLSHSLPSLNATKNVIFTMISPAPEILYVGYLTGVVKVWHIAVTNPQFVFGKEYELPPVRCLCYSSKYRKLIVGYEGTYENQHGRFIKLEKNALRVYVPNASGESNDCTLLDGFNGSCFSIGLCERNDWIIAISSEECGMYVWNMNTFTLDMMINIPKFDNQPQIITQILTLERPNANYLIFGASDGSVVVSELVIEGNTIVWKPLKRLTIHNDGNYAVEYLHYEEKIDTLIVGNTFSTATFISNFFSEGLGVNFSVTNEQKIDEEI